MNPKTTAVFSFPIKAPDGAVTRDDVSALSQLELCLAYQRDWCEHKPSITVTVREDEWMDVGAWVFKHFDEVSGEWSGRCWLGSVWQAARRQGASGKLCMAWAV